MGFWTKRILVMFIVVVGAALVIMFMPASPTLDSQGKVIEKRSIQQNMADFYEEFSLTSRNRISEKYGEFVIPLDSDDQFQLKTYNELEDFNVRANDNFNWRGEIKMRAFAKDLTLKTVATGYAEQEGLHLVWGLDQDFIIKERFLSDNTYSGMLRDLAGAIDANFTPTVEVYYCRQKRAMVITDELDEQLAGSCSIAY